MALPFPIPSSSAQLLPTPPMNTHSTTNYTLHMLEMDISRHLAGSQAPHKPDCRHGWSRNSGHIRRPSVCGSTFCVSGGVVGFSPLVSIGELWVDGKMSGCIDGWYRTEIWRGILMMNGASWDIDINTERDLYGFYTIGIHVESSVES